MRSTIPLFEYVSLFVYLEDFSSKVPFLVLLPVLLVKYDVSFKKKCSVLNKVPKMRTKNCQKPQIQSCITQFFKSFYDNLDSYYFLSIIKMSSFWPYV